MSGSIRFTESMRGQVTGPARCSGTALALLDLQVVLSDRPAQGMAGRQGSIAGGRLHVPCLCSQALEVSGGSVEILRQVGAHACEMRYELHCHVPGSTQQFRLQGIKDVNRHSGLLWPRALWRETTTLRVTLVQWPEAPGLAPLAGTVAIQGGDFVRQLASFRSVNPLGRWHAFADVLQFLGFFVARLWRVYAPRWRRA